MSTRGIRLEHVSKNYGTDRNVTRVLDDIDFEIVPGEFLCLIGESGCGKSTVLQMIAGFEKPTSGHLYSDGNLISGPDFRRSIVFQDNSLLPWLTVEKNISLGLEIRGEAATNRSRVAHFINLMGLDGFEKHYPAQLSGGMAQRVAIARSLINNANVLLLDEPFGALDAFTRMRLQDELINIWQREKLTTVFVTHDIDEAVYLGTRVLMMSAHPGRIARLYQVPLPYPRDRVSTGFFSLRGAISTELFGLTKGGTN